MYSTIKTRDQPTNLPSAKIHEMTDDSHETVGNEKRALWRNICRKRLADHRYRCNRNRMIEKGLTETTVETLGIRLKP